MDGHCSCPDPLLKTPAEKLKAVRRRSSSHCERVKVDAQCRSRPLQSDLPLMQLYLMGRCQ